MPDCTSFFENETWTAGIIGLGYVGLPLAVNSVQRGLRAIGFDVDPAAVERLRAGHSPHEEWAARLVTLGRQVTVSGAGLALNGRAEGVGPDGALLVRLADGRLERVLAGDVTLRGAV